MKKRILCCLLCCIAILWLTAASAFAADLFPDPDRTGSIAFDFSAGGKDFPGGSVELRQVAALRADGENLDWCEDFVPVGLPIEALESNDCAGKLRLYAAAARIPATQVEIGSNGLGKAQELAPGVYLMSQEEPFEGYLELSPALITLPLRESGQWIYDVDAMPKLETLREETTVPTTEPTPPHLPQTGQTNWPVPVLALGGSVLILLGICLRRDKRNET